MATGRVTDDEREQIIATLRETENVRETARRHGRGIATVSRIAAAAEVDVAERSQTKNATRARVADNAARLADLQALLLGDALRLRRQLWQPVVEKKAMVVSYGGDSGSRIEVAEVELTEPTFADKQRIVTSAAIVVDKVIAIDRHQDAGDEDLSDVAAFSDWMMGESAAA